MSLTLRTAFGCTEAVIDDGGLNRFYQVAGILADCFKIDFSSKEDDVYAINWCFKLNRYRLTLQYSIYDGISIFPTKKKDAGKKENHAVQQLASVLQGKLMNLDRMR